MSASDLTAIQQLVFADIKQYKRSVPPSARDTAKRTGIHFQTVLSSREALRKKGYLNEEDVPNE